MPDTIPEPAPDLPHSSASAPSHKTPSAQRHSNRRPLLSTPPPQHCNPSRAIPPVEAAMLQELQKTHK